MPYKTWTTCLLALVFLLVFIVTIKEIFPPANFPAMPFYHVDRGKTVSQIAAELKTKNFIQSPLAFKIFVRLMGGEKSLQVGTYFFRQPTSVINIALKLTNHFLGYKPVTITIYEGMSNAKIAALLTKNFKDISQKEFLAKTEDLQGRLFPDTYFLSPYDTVDDIVYEMNQNFNEQIAPLKMKILISGKPLSEILVMASLIEREAKIDEDRHLISGILWKRLSISMPLQVDVAKETYKEQGLPDQPIANPGIASIEAAISPTASPYLYYLTGRDGKMYYAKDFAEHKKNRRLYLD
ncbi:MAG: endolytic transglycosylase MltG [Candidatus Paceibacterota bacterium]|jgi:UPF0755 protein